MALQKYLPYFVNGIQCTSVAPQLDDYVTYGWYYASQLQECADLPGACGPNVRMFEARRTGFSGDLAISWYHRDVVCHDRTCLERHAGCVQGQLPSSGSNTTLERKI